MSDWTPEEQIRRLSRRGLLWGAGAAVVAYGTLHWLDNSATEDGMGWPFKRVLGLNEKLAGLYLSNRSHAQEFPAGDAREPKVNGPYGLESEIDVANWRLQVVGAAEGLAVTLAELQALPVVDMVTELRCIEGWSCVVHWTGCRLRDFVAKYPPKDRKIDVERLETLPPYIGMATPDGEYFVGLDMASAVHPQTLLCWAMNGEPLTQGHGAPLRLVIPAKYGVKNIKRIGTITYATERPKDFWASDPEGYDWFAGL
ncbi:MAG TPA: molybdopterin-dependent oxidoreductase [Fimbriimonadaceae bacterium]|nr:molybdopterin-dependent oxidoreductase [Fimbriimonadaceae bacterium]